jgi:hypothetical protein
MAERASDDSSLAAALESDPPHPDADTSGAEDLSLATSGPSSVLMPSPPAGLLQSATSSDNDGRALTSTSPSAQQPPSSGDGVYDPEHPGTCTA